MLAPSGDCARKTLQQQPPTDGVLVFVGINAGIDDVSEEIIHDLRQALGVHHAVQRADEHRLGGVEALTRLLDVVAVAQHPRNHLHLYTTRHTRTTRAQYWSVAC